MFKIECEKALPSECRTRYKGIAFDGCWFYLTVYHACKIIQLDSTFHPKQCFKTAQSYTVLCFDPVAHCFWAAADNCLSTIYRLNECFEELESIAIFCPGTCGGIVTGISRDCCTGKLAVSFAWDIIHLDPLHPKNCTRVKQISCEWIMSVLATCPYTLCLSMGERGQTVRIFSACGKEIGETKIPCSLTIEAAVFVPCLNDCMHYHFYVLASKHRIPYLLDCVIAHDALCEPVRSCNYGICHKSGRCEAHCRCKESCCCKEPCRCERHTSNFE